MTSSVLSSLCLLTVCVGRVVGGSFCTFIKDYYPYSTVYKYCSDGCCTSDCCYYSISDRFYAVTVWIIVGCVVGGVVVVSVITAVICCCIRQRGARGQVMRYPTSTNTAQVAVVSSANQTNTALTASPVPVQPYGYQYGGQYGGQFASPYPLQPMGPPPYDNQPGLSGDKDGAVAQPPYPPAGGF